MSIVPYREALRIALDELKIADPSQFDEKLVLAKVSLNEFVDHARLLYSQNSAINLNELLAPELSGEQFDHLYGWIKPFFLRELNTRSDLILVATNDRTLSIRTDNGHVESTIFDLATGSFKNTIVYNGNNTFSMSVQDTSDGSVININTYEIDTFEKVDSVSLNLGIANNTVSGLLFFSHGNNWFLMTDRGTDSIVYKVHKVTHEVTQNILNSLSTTHIVHMSKALNYPGYFIGYDRSNTIIYLDEDLNIVHSSSYSIGDRQLRSIDYLSNGLIVVSGDNASGTGSHNNCKVISFNPTDGFTELHSRTPGTNAIAVDKDNNIYAYTVNNVLRKYDSELSSQLDSVNLSGIFSNSSSNVAVSDLFISEDNYLYIHSRTVVAKIDLIDLSVVWSNELMNIVSNIRIHGMQPLRAPGGLVALGLV